MKTKKIISYILCLVMFICVVQPLGTATQADSSAQNGYGTPPTPPAAPESGTAEPGMETETEAETGPGSGTDSNSDSETGTDSDSGSSSDLESSLESQLQPELIVPAYESAPEQNALISDDARAALQELIAEQPVMALVYLSDFYTVRTEPSHNSAEAAVVPSGHQVLIQDVVTDEYLQIWVKVLLGQNDSFVQGYVERKNLACSDARFLGWENDFDVKPPASAFRSFSMAAASVHADINEFPESYRDALTKLKNAHPNWTFVKMNTNLNWSDVMAGQMYGARSLIHNSAAEHMKRGYYGQNWSYASETAVAYYLDPRNWLNENNIFMFEQLTYNATYHTEPAVQLILNNTFMSGLVPGDNRTYAKIFHQVGADLKVSPFHLASRVRQEQGVNGTSALISGRYPGYEGLYNYFNVAASGSNDTQVIVNGLTRARNEGWTTPYLSIYGGARFISTNYILRGQDTIYLQKFDVDSSFDGLYWHQYMQNIAAPVSESLSIRNLYYNSGAINNTFVFKIPVYNNMPLSTVVLPVTADKITLSLPSGYNETNSRVFIDGKEYTNTDINIDRLKIDQTGIQAQSAVMYRYDKAGVPVGMYVWTISYKNGQYTTTPVPELENLLSYHGFSIRITGMTGIRVKTGINITNRSRLTSSGLAGFKLQEYGTLVMTGANYQSLPLVRGGDKVGSGIAYGKDANGRSIDAVFESVDGRYRFTSVLTGLPPEQYKTEFVFRGYIIINKDGVSYTIYGPPVSRSIYALAEQLIAGKYYPAGSETDRFLKKIIQDAK